MKLKFSRRIFENRNVKCHNQSTGNRVVPCRQTDMTTLIVAFRNFANAPKNCLEFHENLTNLSIADRMLQTDMFWTYIFFYFTKKRVKCKITPLFYVCVGVSETTFLCFIIAVRTISHNQKAQTYSCMRNVRNTSKRDFWFRCVDLVSLRVVNLRAPLTAPDNLQ